MTTTDKETYYKEPQNTFIIAIKDLNNFQVTCNTYEIQPTSIFTTAEEATYAIFNTGIAIDDLRMRYVVQGCLNRLFNSYKSVRTFEKELEIEFNLYEELLKTENKNYIMEEEGNSVLDVIYLLYAACYSVKSRASGGNASKDMKSFLKAININMDSLHLVKILPFSKDTFLCDTYKYIYRQPHENVELIFTVTTTELMQYLNGNTATLASDTKGISIPTIKTSAWDESIDIESLIANDDAACKLLKELYSGGRQLSLVELRHLAKSLCNVKNAQTALEETIKCTELYNDITPGLIKYLMSYYRKIGYASSSSKCEGNCQHYDGCCIETGLKVDSLIDVLYHRDHTIKRINSSKQVFKKAVTIRADLIERFNNDCASEDNKMYIYKCFTGVGKTKAYLDKIPEFIEHHKTVIIALPNHKLKDEIITRLSSKKNEDLITDNIIVVPELPSCDNNLMQCLNSFYSIGDFTGANNYLKEYTAALDDSDFKTELENYLGAVSLLKNKENTTGKIIFTTHERLFSLKSIEPEVVIIDEDITSSSLKTETVDDIAELKSLKLLVQSLVKKGQFTKELNSLLFRLSLMNMASENTAYSFDDTFRNKTKFRAFIIKEISANRDVSIKSRVVDLLINGCTYIKINNKDGVKCQIHFIYKRVIPFNNSKIFIMSATADEEIYKQLYGNIVFRDFGIPELKARIFMKYEHSYSKKWFNDNNKDLKEHLKYTIALRDMEFSREEKKFVPRNIKDQPLIITFKERVGDFKEQGFDTIMYFGNTIGIDAHKGKNTTVFGTYNLDPVTYTLLTKAIYPDAKINKVPEYSKMLVENKDYRFYIFTSKESREYRKIQLWKIESETIQAIGRARPIDNACSISIYSNVPPSGFKILGLNC